MVIVNTRQNRSSAIGLGLAALVVLPAPDGSVALADRQQVTAAYAGISAGVIMSYDFVEFTGVTVKAATFVNVTLEPT
jgi:hypothetical protein